MSLTRINTNIAALTALHNLSNVNQRLSIHQLRLTTGKQINSPSDNAAGWTIATQMSTRADGLGQALKNISSSKDMTAVAEGHLANIQDILEQMRVRAEEAANDTLGTDERNAIGDELYNLALQINEEVNQAEWNGQAILSSATGATGGGKFNLQIGAETGNTLVFDIAENSDISTASNGGFEIKAAGTAGAATFAALMTISYATSGGLTANAFASSVKSQSDAQNLMSKLDSAIEDISDSLSYTGAVVNRLTYQETSLTTAHTRTETARSTIEDADMAYEQLEATKLQILQQTATAMLAQANMSPQSILSLFGG